MQDYLERLEIVDDVAMKIGVLAGAQTIMEERPTPESEKEYEDARIAALKAAHDLVRFLDGKRRGR